MLLVHKTHHSLNYPHMNLLYLTANSGSDCLGIVKGCNVTIVNVSIRQMKVTYVLTHTYSLLGIKSILPMQVLESLATFLPSGQTQIPPSSEDRHSCSHPSDEQRVVAEKK